MTALSVLSPPMAFKLAVRNRYPALASRDFLIFWVGQFVSLIGTWMQNTTLPYLAYRLTGSTFDLGLIGFASSLPTLLLALPAGVFVERLDKRKTVIAMQAIMMVQAFTLAYLTFSGHIQIWQIVILAFVLGAASTVEITARQAMLVELVGKESLPNAIALQATIFNAARVLGPLLFAPFLVAFQGGGEGWAFFLNGLSFLFIIVSLFFVRTPFKLQETEVTEKGRNYLGEFKEGQRYIMQNSVIAVIILLAAILGFFGFPFGQQIPALARDVLYVTGQTDTSVAARTSAMYMMQGIGALIAAIFLASYSGFKRRGLLLTIGQFAFILALIGVSLVTKVPPALFLMLVLGWGMVTQLNLMNVLIQVNVPNELRGRVFSSYLWALQGVAPFGSLFIGWMAQQAGLSTTALVCGVICLVAAGAVHISNPKLRKLTA
jgi:MFS family permease